MGAYLSILTTKTQLRLKRTNPKLLICHGGREELKIGDEVVWAAGAQRKRYCRKHADQYNIVYEIPERLKDKVAPLKPEQESESESADEPSV